MTVTGVVHAVRPHLRGWVHAGTFPLAVAAGTVLVVLSPAGPVRWASAVFALAAAVLFATSALYHCRRWSARVSLALKRADHANIFVVIAATYTPFAVALLDAGAALRLLALVWGGALAGVALKVAWPEAPRWLSVPLYVALGWAAVAWLPAFWASGGPAVVVLVVVGGLLYTLGALVYGFRRPNPVPAWFGFHEVFHVLTVAGFTVHLIGVYLAALGPSSAGAPA